MRIAAIDIGTNSVHMIVVRVRPDLSFEGIDQEEAMLRLRAGGLDGRALTVEAVTGALQALARFKRLADSHNPAMKSWTLPRARCGKRLTEANSWRASRPRLVFALA